MYILIKPSFLLTMLLTSAHTADWYENKHPSTSYFLFAQTAFLNSLEYAQRTLRWTGECVRIVKPISSARKQAIKKTNTTNLKFNSSQHQSLNWLFNVFTILSNNFNLWIYDNLYINYLKIKNNNDKKNILVSLPIIEYSTNHPLPSETESTTQTKYTHLYRKKRQKNNKTKESDYVKNIEYLNPEKSSTKQINSKSTFDASTQTIYDEVVETEDTRIKLSPYAEPFIPVNKIHEELMNELNSKLTKIGGVEKISDSGLKTLLTCELFKQKTLFVNRCDLLKAEQKWQEYNDHIYAFNTDLKNTLKKLSTYLEQQAKIK